VRRLKAEFALHELSFAEQILRCVEQQAREHGAPRVSRVKLTVGQLSGVDRSNLAFCLEAITDGSVMQGAEIEVDEVGPELLCPSCGRLPVDGVVEPVCPACGKEAELVLNSEICIEEIELDVEEDQTQTES